MPTYKYTAIKPDGSKINGTYTGESKVDIINNLRRNSFYPLKVQQVDVNREINISTFKKVKLKDISIFCRQLYTMLNAGLSLVNCLEILKVQTENKKLRKTIQSIYEDIQKGLTFSESLNKYSDVFPTLLINMVEAGEASGNLDVIMDRMALHFEKENKILNTVKGAMVYPIVLGVIALVVVVFLIVFVMPTFTSMFEGSGVELPVPTRILLSISDIIKKFWYLIIPSISSIIMLMRIYLNSNRGRYAFDKLKLRIPIINVNIKKIITSRFTRTLSTLLSSGVPLLNALNLVSKIVGNKVVQEGILSSKEEIKKGINLSTPISNMGIFPPMVISMLKIGEESGALDEVLEKTADFYDEELEASLKKLTTLLEPLMIVIMAIIIGAIVIAMVLPMFDMINTIQY